MAIGDRDASFCLLPETIQALTADCYFCLPLFALLSVAPLPASFSLLGH